MQLNQVANSLLLCAIKSNLKIPRNVLALFTWRHYYLLLYSLWTIRYTCRNLPRATEDEEAVSPSLSSTLDCVFFPSVAILGVKRESSTHNLWRLISRALWVLNGWQTLLKSFNVAACPRGLDWIQTQDLG